MKVADIQAELTRLFDAFDDAGGVIIWHDPDVEFAEVAEELELPGVEVMLERENEEFLLMRELNGDLTGRKILLYRPRERRIEGDWLADVEVRSKQFSADYASIQMRELGCAESQDMRAALAARKAFLAKRGNIKKLVALRGSYETPQQLDVAIIAARMGLIAADPVVIVRAFCELDTDAAATALAALEAAGVAESFANAIAAWTGFAGDVADVAALRKHVLLTSFWRSAPSGCLAGLEACLGEGKEAFCHDAFAQWAAEGSRDMLFEALRAVEAEVGLGTRLENAGLSDLSSAEVFPRVDAEVLRRLFALVSAASDASDEILEVCGRRRGLTWYASFEPLYRGVEAAAQMQRFYRAHANGLGALPTERVWRAYEREWYQMDTWYRELHMALSDALKDDDYGLAEDFRVACTTIENLYKGWYLREVNSRWLSAAAADLGALGYASGIGRQRDFCMGEMSGVAESKKRAWVVVSDALRYEVAAELAQRLERETKGSCNLAAVQSVLPSITKCGMPAVLPHGTYEIASKDNGKGFTVLVDGCEAPNCVKRQEVIRRTYPSGVAVTYDEFFNALGRDQRKELVGEADVVYVFHNTVDALGDKQATERKVFQGCADAIDEICGLVKLVVREFGASDVFVTADHGFLYTDQPLDEAEHASLSDVHGAVAVESGRRYVVARPGATSDVFVPVKLDSSEGLVGLFPRECVRIHMAGGGDNYVHGGISLQEMCVPVLHFTNHRAGTKGYVEAECAQISLVTQIDVISNSLFTLEFLQNEPVGGKVLPCEYEVFLADAAHEPVSDIVRVVASSAAADASERVTRASFGLRSGFAPNSDETYLLLARNAETKQVTCLRELRLQIAFAAPVDFGW